LRTLNGVRDMVEKHYDKTVPFHSELNPRWPKLAFAKGVRLLDESGRTCRS
jgi:hypothetical protein